MYDRVNNYQMFSTNNLCYDNKLKIKKQLEHQMYSINKQSKYAETN